MQGYFDCRFDKLIRAPRDQGFLGFFGQILLLLK